jgi:hypothetical protein
MVYEVAAPAVAGTSAAAARAAAIRTTERRVKGRDITVDVYRPIGTGRCGVEGVGTAAATAPHQSPLWQE